jgi:PEP-CTERM motif
MSGLRQVLGVEEISMKYKILSLVGAVAFVMAASSVAKADSFDLNVDFCSSPCLSGGGTGTVTLTQYATNEVQVTVTLTGLLFHDQGLPTFVFNGPLSLSLVAGSFSSNGVGDSWSDLIIGNTSDSPATIHADGAGYFDYGFNCTGGSGACEGSTPPSQITFILSGTGLTPAALETLSNGSTTNLSNVDFAANVSGGGCTGMIGGGNGTSQSTASSPAGGDSCGTTTVPEPGSLMLFGTGLLGMAGFLRCKLLG